MKPKYYALNQLVEMVDEPNSSICKRVLEQNKELFRTARGSTNNHQTWEGGYLDHITDIMNVAKVLYPTFNDLRKLPFSLSDSLLVLFLHDLEKPWKYEIRDGETVSIQELKDKENQVWPFVQNKINEYGFVLTEDHWNGIRYVEGEKEHYTPGKRTQAPLAAFAHICDNWSARGWHDHPKVEDEWGFRS
jgi:23S rRNA maturation-related 3'-5' exoribonuclease YhaM